MMTRVGSRTASGRRADHAAQIGISRLVIELREGEIMSVRIVDALTVLCLEGQLWITQQRDPDDTVLGKGESFDLSRRGVSLLEALRDARVAIVPASALPARRLGQH